MPSMPSGCTIVERGAGTAYSESENGAHSTFSGRRAEESRRNKVEMLYKNCRKQVGSTTFSLSQGSPYAVLDFFATFCVKAKSRNRTDRKAIAP
jgi:hypothetical protein